MNTKTTLIILVLFLMSLSLFAEAMAESSASSTRGKYLAGQGIIIPPEEIYPESYIAQVNYEYPFPSKEIGISLYSGTRTVSARGEENLLHIGIQGRKIDFPDLPPLNLVFVIDCSSSMSEKNKLEWIKESCGIFINKVRDTDFVSLVVFNDTPEVLIPSVQMNTAEKRKQFLDTVLELTTMGGTDIKAALETAYSQVMANFRQNYVNRVIFISDGTDFSDRLVSANAKSGEIRMSLLWNNRNDLDLHVVPPSSEEIFYGNKKSLCGGELDVDMNVEGETTKPIENIYWLSGRAPRGRYRVYVQNYDYHENVRGKTSFTVELKRRNEVTYFEGEISGSGKSSNVPVFEFNFNPEDSGNNSGQYEIVERYNKMGINISTIGVGTKFDVELMRNLAHRGGGSSRFISDHDEMVEIFDTEFDRMVAPAARNVKIKLTFPEKTQILGTWGYDNSVRGSSVDYFIPTLHNRDYETILVRMRTPQGAKTGENTFATVSVSYETLNGKTITLDPTDISCTVVDHEIATSGYSNTMVLHSGTMLHLAETLKTIGNKYYSYQDELLKLQQQRNQPREALFERGKKIAEECLQLAFDEKKLLENAKLRLNETAFDDEIEILKKYIEIFCIQMEISPEISRRYLNDTELAPVISALPSKEYMQALSDELVNNIPGNKNCSLAIADFSWQGTAMPQLPNFVRESLLACMSRGNNHSIVERQKFDYILREQELSISDLLDTSTAIRIGKISAAQYIITGTIMEMSSSILIFGRIIDVETGIVKAVAQVIIPREKIVL